MIDAQLAAFLHEGVGIHIGTRNDRLEPNGARAVAVTRGRRTACTWSSYVAEVAARRVLPDLESNGQAAVVFGTADRRSRLPGQRRRS